jgi:hypothetical protein
VLSFVAGVHFAILQTSYFLVLEAFVSSQALSYFIAIFFWLVGLLVGLWIRRARMFVPLLAVGAASYYGTWWLARLLPFASSMYLVAGACSIVSGLLPGYFFGFIGPRVRPVSRALFYENNGFVLGLFAALTGATRFGSALVSLGPLLTGIATWLAYVAIGADRD